MIWLTDLLNRSPSEIVQALHKEAQQQVGTQVPLVLKLDASAWPQPGILYFKSELILTGRFVDEHPSLVDLQKATLIALDFYLKLRMAAAFALKVQRFMEARGLDVDKAFEAWACWEAGYSDLSDVRDFDVDMILSRAVKLSALHKAGQEVLQVQEVKGWDTRRIQVSDSVLGALPRPPKEIGIRWSAGKMPQGWDAKRLRVDVSHLEGERQTDVAHLAAWLAFSPEEIVGRIAEDVEKAASAKRVVLELEPPNTAIEPRGALIFEKESIFPASIVGEAITRAHEAISAKDAARMIAKWKRHLRRAAVYAALVEASAEQQNIKPEAWIRLDALATFGFAEERDVPDEALGAIRSKRSELLELYNAGLFVLEACPSQPDHRQGEAAARPPV
jgi:hypothetical protein